MRSKQLHLCGDASGHHVSACLRTKRWQSGAMASFTSDEGRHPRLQQLVCVRGHASESQGGSKGRRYKVPQQ